MTGLVPAALYILSLVAAWWVIILGHELGHYWMTRLVGLPIEWFRVGTGPGVTWVRRGVRYNIGLWPTGGGVQMSHESRRPLCNLAIDLAGPLGGQLTALLLWQIGLLDSVGAVALSIVNGSELNPWTKGSDGRNARRAFRTWLRDRRRVKQPIPD